MAENILKKPFVPNRTTFEKAAIKAEPSAEILQRNKNKAIRLLREQKKNRI